MPAGRTVSPIITSSHSLLMSSHRQHVRGHERHRLHGSHRRHADDEDEFRWDCIGTANRIGTAKRCPTSWLGGAGTGLALLNKPSASRSRSSNPELRLTRSSRTLPCLSRQNNNSTTPSRTTRLPWSGWRLYFSSCLYKWGTYCEIMLAGGSDEAWPGAGSHTTAAPLAAKASTRTQRTH